ncbi:hypothetical protein FQZ97_747660 [compost metagenome]
MMIPVSDPKPSISTNSEFRVFSLSSFPPGMAPFPRLLPTASISSIKIIQGAFSFACLNRSRTRAAPTPTNISTKSDPESEKNGTLASPATALAIRVLPVPGGPTSRAPLGILPPSSVYLPGFLRNSTISVNSSLASSRPATSAKVIFTRLSASNRAALDFPILNMAPPGPPPDIRLIRKYIRPNRNNHGNNDRKICM